MLLLVYRKWPFTLPQHRTILVVKSDKMCDTGHHQTWNITRGGTRASEVWVITNHSPNLIHISISWAPLLSSLLPNAKQNWKFCTFFAIWPDLWLHLLTQGIKMIPGRVRHTLRSTLITVLCFCHRQRQHSKWFPTKMTPFSIYSTMADKNAGMYPLKIQNFWKSFLPQVCVDLKHNSVNLAKLISKICKWWYTLMHIPRVMSGVHMHVHMCRCPPVFKNVWTDCSEIWCVVRNQLNMHFIPLTE